MLRNMSHPGSPSRLWVLALVLSGLLWAVPTGAQTCQTSAEMDGATRSALDSAAHRIFDMGSRGDTAALKQNAIPSLAADFSGIAAAVADNQAAFTGAQATSRSIFLLQAASSGAPGSGAASGSEFLCGVFGSLGQTSGSSVFVIPNLPAGKYGIVILDVKGPQGAYTLSLVLQQLDSQLNTWKLGGFYPKLAQVSGHDGQWFLERAREYKAKSQNHNAWYYYLEARDLLAPLPFVSTLATDKLYDEAQAVKPADLPSSAAPMSLAAGAGKICKVTALFPLVVGGQFDLVVKYDATDVSNSALTFAQNSGVMKALLAKYPEVRDAFDAVVARAVEPSGRDYGSMLQMKDIK